MTSHDSPLRRLFLTLSSGERELAAERANREPEWWNPYIETSASSTERSERAALLRVASLRRAS